ncbi:hypothetical protein SIN8267_02427 [Sinobacterium norvegicum]|uniref:DUF4124 domain-containing protein n=1 Tax=Sinobacterium norvegicum TaxID=1641715 RepID=A0ABM9AGH4_9GAMM|nr:DUF4124 domain-containing protein [Sinobacterium norvegicum]CAH0992308.1 hypothetical protein SIN8267_02427 [Sinobacterium norvegicum]
MIRSLLTAVLLLMLTSLSISSAYAAKQSYYRWNDASGNVHYGKHPPAGADAVLVDIHTGKVIPRTPAAEDTAATGEAATESQQPEQQSGLEPGEAERICGEAKKHLELVQRPGIIRMRDEDGNPYVLDDAAKKREMDNAREAIKTYCQ